MNDENKKKFKLSLNGKFLIAVLIIGSILYKYVKPIDILMIIFAMLEIVLFLFLIFLLSAAYKIIKHLKERICEKIDSVYHPERGEKAVGRKLMREKKAEKEQVVKRTYSIGSEKYIHQLDEYLANGLIDKNEYRVLKKRYEKATVETTVEE